MAVRHELNIRRDGDWKERQRIEQELEDQSVVIHTEL